MNATFEEVDQPKNIKYAQGGYRKNSGPKPSAHPSHKVFFMLSKSVVGRLHTLTPRTMSKFVIKTIDSYSWDNVKPSGMKPIDGAIPFHVRLPENMAIQFKRFPFHDQCRHLDDCLKEQFRLLDESLKISS